MSTIHATAIAIGANALLIRGPSRAGKSRLAISLIAASMPRRRIRLIGDDRVIVRAVNDQLVVRAHPRIAGFIERRGLGIVAMPCLDHAPLYGVIDISACAIAMAHTTTIPLGGMNFPRLVIVQSLDPQDRRDKVLRWWRDRPCAA